MLYYPYSTYLKEKYGQKVYKLPINLPLTCPNRDGTKGSGGCIYCAGIGAGFEALDNSLPVKEQLRRNMEYIGPRYKAEKFIAYFQNFTNTYLPISQFEQYMNEAVMPGIVEISVSTRPDCIAPEYLDVLQNIQKQGVNISIELGLQSASDATLQAINRGHTVQDFINAMNQIKRYGFETCAHMIANLPWDTMADVVAGAKLLNECAVNGVKLHSLYIIKGTVLAELYEKGEVAIPPLEDYIARVIAFLTHLDETIVIHRLLGRAPEAFTLFENYGMSWRKLQDIILSEMAKQGVRQGIYRNLLYK